MSRYSYLRDRSLTESLSHWSYRYVLPSLLSLKKRENEPSTSIDFFLLGSGRNGSTLLASILNNHPRLRIHPEAYFLPQAIMRYGLSPFSSPKGIERFLKASMAQPKYTGTYNIPRHTLNTANVSGFAQTYGTCMRRALGIEPSSEELLGDKTPILVHYIDAVFPVFSRSKYLFLIRDPADVAYSYLQIKDSANHAFDAAIWRIRDSYRAYWYLKARTPVHLIGYEDLVSQPDAVLTGIANFLGVQPIIGLHNVQRDLSEMAADGLDHLKNVSSALSTSNIGKGRKALSSEQISALRNAENDYERIRLDLKG